MGVSGWHVPVLEFASQQHCSSLAQTMPRPHPLSPGTELGLAHEPSEHAANDVLQVVVSSV